MPDFPSDMWNNKSASSIQDSYHSCTRGTSTTLLRQLHAGERNSKPLLTSFVTSPQHFNSRQLLPKRDYHFWISTCRGFSEGRTQTTVFWKETYTHNNLHFSTFHPNHFKRAIPYSQFLSLRRLCSKDDELLIKSREKITFFTWVAMRLLRLNRTYIG